MQNPIRVETKIGDLPFIIETGRLARLCDGAVLVRYGDAAVLVTVTTAEERAEQERDFLALTVEYREKTYASGKIPGGFIKREGRPSTSETLTARLIDRPIRPLFPEGFAHEILVHAIVVSSDQRVMTDVMASNGASAALLLAALPFRGPVATVRVGRIGGRFTINPTFHELDESELDLVVSAAPEGIIMVEAGARELAEEEMIAAFEFAQEPLGQLLDLQRRLVELAAPAPREWRIHAVSGELCAQIRERYAADIEKAVFLQEKKERYAALDALQERVRMELVPRDEKGNPLPDASPSEADVTRAYARVEEELVRRWALDGRRSDGRGPADIRAISAEVGVLPRTHGSALFQRGETQALVTATLGTRKDAQVVDGMYEEYEERFMLHYNFPPFSTGEVKPIRSPGRREIGHGALAQRALEPVLPDEESFPYTIRVVSEILMSNGSSSMATVCGGTLALMDAGVPIRAPVAGIAMGLVQEGPRVAILSDILGSEDALGDMDFKVAGTRKGITALQMDLKRPGVDLAILRRALGQARQGRLYILEEMLRALPEPRSQLSPHAPRFERVKIPVDKIGLLIGPGGKTIREMEERTGATIEVEEDGTVFLFCKDAEGIRRAVEEVKSLTQELELGKTYRVRVSGIKDYGCFVQVLPAGPEGLMHISEITDGYLERVEDVLQMGQEIEAKLIEMSPDGKMRFSMKQALLEQGKELPRVEGAGRCPDSRPRGGREDRDRAGRDRGRDRERDRNSDRPDREVPDLRDREYGGPRNRPWDTRPGYAFEESDPGEGGGGGGRRRRRRGGRRR